MTDRFGPVGYWDPGAAERAVRLALNEMGSRNTCMGTTLRRRPSSSALQRAKRRCRIPALLCLCMGFLWLSLVYRPSPDLCGTPCLHAPLLSGHLKGPQLSIFATYAVRYHPRDITLIRGLLQDSTAPLPRQQTQLSGRPSQHCRCGLVQTPRTRASSCQVSCLRPDIAMSLDHGWEERAPS